MPIAPQWSNVYAANAHRAIQSSANKKSMMPWAILMCYELRLGQRFLLFLPDSHSA